MIVLTANENLILLDDSIFETRKLKRQLANLRLINALGCDSLDTGQSLVPEPPQSIVGMRV